MPYVRTRPLGDDDVTIEIKKRIWWNPFSWLWPRAVPISTVRSSLNKLDWDILELIDKLKAKLATRMVLADEVAAEYEDAKNNRYDKFGVGEWIWLDDKQFKEKVKPYTDRPKDDFKSFFNPSILREFKLNNQPKIDPRTGTRRAGEFAIKGHVPGEGASVLGVTLPEHQKFQVHLRDGEKDVDMFVTAKDEKKSSNGVTNETKKAQLRTLRQNNPWDRDVQSQKEWEAHINELWESEFGGSGR